MWLTPALYRLLCLSKYRFLNKWNFQPHASSPPPLFFIVVKLHHKIHHPNCILRVQLILLNTLAVCSHYPCLSPQFFSSVHTLRSKCGFFLVTALLVFNHTIVILCLTYFSKSRLINIPSQVRMLSLKLFDILHLFYFWIFENRVFHLSFLCILAVLELTRLALNLKRSAWAIS